jgi:release factor glutamine methyltransferase
VTVSDASARGRELLDRHGAIHTRQTFSLCGRTWFVDPGVFSPTLCFSTSLFTNWVPFPPGGTFLEVGPGTGVTTVTAVLDGCASATAIDINPVAVANTRANAQLHRVADRVQLLLGDAFALWGALGRFDVVYWNSCFINADPPMTGGLASSFFDPCYHAHAAFLQGVGAHLTPSGRAFLGFSSLGDHAALRQLCVASGLGYEVIAHSGRLLPDWQYQLLELTPEVRG